MINKVTAYECRCDNCNEILVWGQDYVISKEGEVYSEIAEDSGWYIADSGFHNDGALYYCPDCYFTDENDQLIIKPKILNDEKSN